MSAPKFTPGPWRIERDNSGEPWVRGAWDLVVGEGRERMVLASRAPWSTRAAESDANARLIAAAPELLAALVESIAAHERVECPTYDERVEGNCSCTAPDRWRAVIARATGGEP